MPLPLGHYFPRRIRTRLTKLLRNVIRLLILFLVVSVLLLQFAPNTAPSSVGLLVDTPHCRILDIDPVDPSISNFVHNPGSIRCSSGKSSITHEEGNVLRINWKNVKSFYADNLKHCVYKPIHRQSDHAYVYGPASDPFTDDVTVSDDNIRVECFGKSGEIIYVNFHSLIIPRKTVDERCEENLLKHIKANAPKEVLSVLAIGTDSVSHLNSVRQMPKTRKYLLQKMGAIELKGYTKVGDNTFMNIVPLTTGKFVAELPWDTTMKDVPFDRFNFIWNNFSKSGYRTLFAEDYPLVSAFAYMKGGFRQPPADHYNRGWSMAAEEEESLWTQKHHCVGDRLETNVLLKYIEDFITLYKDKPYFGVPFITRLTHEEVNDAGWADEPYSEFFQRVHSKGLLNNTVLIYFSDHGMRFGDLRFSFVGKVEDRMPFIYLVFPEWFKKKYPVIMKNLETNMHRLTSTFDVHATLKDILHFSGEAGLGSTRNRGISLFKEVPRDRTCDDAGIAPHWCMCLQRESISVTSDTVVQAANTLVQDINNMLADYADICETLKVKEIKNAARLVSERKDVNDNIYTAKAIYLYFTQFVRPLQKVVVYQLTLVTSPGSGTFEATVIYDETSEQYRRSGDISRINKYGNQSICMTKDFELRKYCYCKNVK